MHIQYIGAFLIAFVVSASLIPVLRRFAIKVDFVDKPVDIERKLHKEPVPMAASIGIFISFFVAYLAFVPEVGWQTLAVSCGGLMILGIGLVDDWFKARRRDFPSLPKALVQIAAAVVAYFSGIVFTGFTNPFNGEMIVLPTALQFLLTVMWIFGVTTVINFMDGLDGLAGGLASISSMTLFVVAVAKGQSGPAVMAIVLTGSALGYLIYNKYPAKAYMADSGATFLGYILAIVALSGAFKQVTFLSLFIPVLALGVPIFDNIFVVLKRIANRQPINKGDTGQAHFRLLSKGLSQKQAVSFLLLINLCFCLLSIIILILKV